MRTYAMYVGQKETKVPKERIYLVGYYETPKSYVIRCKGVEFVYSSFKTLSENWTFYEKVKYPTQEVI